MTKLLREPLLHFLLIGAAIFAAFQWTAGDPEPRDGEIVVTRARIEHLAAIFGRTHLRTPTSEELDGLIADHVREEAAVRAALAMGLDRDDGIIRRRLRQKLEFVSEDLAAPAEPSDDELRAWLVAHPEAFRVEPRFTFRHVYLDPERHGENLQRDVAQLLARLRQGARGDDPTALGDPLLLGHAFRALPAGEVRKLFGDVFAAALGELDPGQWQGPITSGYGVHLVLVEERAEGRLPDLVEVREAVRREWANALRVAANDKLYQLLLQRYEVTIEAPRPSPEGQRLAEARR